MSSIPARRWWSIAAPALAVRGLLASCNMRGSPKQKTWPAGYLPGLTVSIPRCRSIRRRLRMAQRGWLRHDVNQERTRGTTTLDFRFVFFLGIGNLFVAGRQFYIVNLLLPGLIVELCAAFVVLPDHLREP